jgi:alkaline phosphatase
MVGSGRINDVHHANIAYSALHAMTRHDTIEFSPAIKEIVNLTNVGDTLILVTADHGHVMIISGYFKRGNPIIIEVISFQSRKLVLDKQGLPFTTLGYQNGLGFHDFSGAPNADYVHEFRTNVGR